ncbi:MAG: hypothetical protein B7Z37_04880 [Verrucomicrobia bacterium 12-59-8]|nr:MAG: hypothetical protein B7Z37_04880 [Verrucomicrobia bacterium 12-59-8]
MLSPEAMEDGIAAPVRVRLSKTALPGYPHTSETTHSIMKLTKLVKSGLIALICGAFSATSVQAAMTYSQGDLLLAFRQTGSNQTYVVDLGSATSFRDASSATALGITGIAADMTATFGAGWYTDNTIFASIVGGNAATTGLSGDGTGGSLPYYNRSVYVSKSGTGSASDTPYTNLAVSTVSVASNTIGNTFGNVFAAASATGNNTVGAIIPTSTTNDYTDLVPPGAGTWFSMSGNTEVNPNGTFDLYRLLANTNNASDAPSGNGIAQYQGAFTISSGGVVNFTPEVGAVPEPSRVILLGLGLTGLLMRRRRKA